MGGLVCAIPRRAILRFDSVPVEHRHEREFDDQIRELYANSIIAGALGAEHPDEAAEVCEILSHDRFTHADRVKLFEIIEELLETYDAGPPGQ
jgi:hypothetical protein